MRDLRINFLKMLQIIKTVLSNEIDQDRNLQSYPGKSKLSDSQLVVLSISPECLSIDSENWFLAELKSDYKDDLSNLVYITNALWIEQGTCKLAINLMNEKMHIWWTASSFRYANLPGRSNSELADTALRLTRIRNTVPFASSII